jgi:hypothetical protein
VFVYNVQICNSVLSKQCYVFVDGKYCTLCLIIVCLIKRHLLPLSKRLSSGLLIERYNYKFILNLIAHYMCCNYLLVGTAVAVISFRRIAFPQNDNFSDNIFLYTRINITAESLSSSCSWNIFFVSYIRLQKLTVLWINFTHLPSFFSCSMYIMSKYIIQYYTNND